MGGNRFRFGPTDSFLVITESERKMSEICLDNVYNESSLIRIGRLGLEGGGDTDGGCPYGPSREYPRMLVVCGSFTASSHEIVGDVSIVSDGDSTGRRGVNQLVRVRRA